MAVATNSDREGPGFGDKWVTFICYRRVDGADAAQWLYDALHGLLLPFIPAGHTAAPKLNVYFDQAAPAVDDWTRVHEPALKRARAFCFVCSPGAYTKLSPGDWVHRELEWWLSNRNTAPIIIDPTGEGDRWVPGVIGERWPNAQRLVVVPREWAKLSTDERTAAEGSVRNRLIAGIGESERRTTYEDLERERALTHRLRTRTRHLFASLIVAVCLTVAAAGLAIYARGKAQASESRALAAMAMQSLQGDPLQSLRLSLAAVKTTRTLEAERALSAALAVPRVRLVLVFDRAEFGRSVESVTFSADGKQLLGASADGTARIWDARTGQQVFRLDHGRPVYFAGYSPDGRHVVTAGDGGLVRIWDSNTGNRVHSLAGHDGQVTFAEFSPSGRYLATADRSGRPRLWDLDSGTHVAVLGPNQSGESVRFSRNGDLLATHGRGSRLWDGRSGALVASLDGNDEIYAIRFSPDGTVFFTADSKGSLRLRNVQSLTQVTEWLGHSAAVFEARFSQDGSRVLTASADRTAKIWSTTSRDNLQVLGGGLPFLVNHAIFAPDEARVATFGWDSTLRLWDANIGAQLHALTAHRELVSSAAFSPDGGSIAIGDESGTIFVWDIGRTRGAPFLISDIERTARRGWFTNEDRYIVTIAPDGQVSLVDRTTLQRLGSLQTGHERLHDVWLSPSGDRIVAAGRFSGRALLRVFALHEAFSFSAPKLIKEVAIRDIADPRILEDRGSVSVSSDGARVAVGLKEAAVTVWTTVGNNDMRVLWEVPTAATAVTLSPDGRTLITAGLSHIPEVWDVDAQQLVRRLEGHSSAVVHASFSSNGQEIVTASLDGTARIWNRRSGLPRVVLRGHSGEVTHAEFAPNGNRVVTAGADGTARTWDVDSGLELQRLDGNGSLVTASYTSNGRSIVTAGSRVRVFTVELDDLVRFAESQLPQLDPRPPNDGRVPTGLR
jgi:WD40 repeat protein